MSLQAGCTPESLAAGFAAHGAFPFPVEHLPETAGAKRRLAAVVASARGALPEPWPLLTVQGYLNFFRDGKRSGGYEGPYFQRRRRLGLFALAWAATREAACAQAAADGLWLICEESTWCVPAHAHFHERKPAERRSNLVAAGDPGFIDLFNCETAQCLAESCQVVGPALDAIDGGLLPRAQAEIRRRVIDPLLAGAQPWWFGGQHNWSVWCASSVIAAAGFACPAATWGRIVHLMLGVVDRYIANQGEDGGCDEGVAYWNVAGGCVLRAIEEVRARTGGMVDPWKSARKLGEIMRFPARMHLGDGWFPAFADGGPRSLPATAVLARAAALVDAPELLALAQARSDPASEVDLGRPACGDLVQMQLRALWWLDTQDAVAYPGPKDAWLPDLQVMVAHGAGTSLAAKGGHNAENHNHNDVGQFIVHRHGMPMIVDAGRGEYTAQTFGPQRYELWWTRGRGHAVPQIDGHEQQPGRERQARAVTCRDGALELDCAACYAAEAGIRTLLRRCALDRGTGVVTVTDSIAAGRTVAYALPLLTSAEPRLENGAWVVTSRGQTVRIVSALAGTVERVELDGGQASHWQELWRLTLRGPVADGGTVEVTMSPG